MRAHAAKRPDTIAVRQDGRALTYAQLDERSSRLAQALAGAGAGAGSRVAYLDRSAPELVELLFAASKVGAVAVPLNWRLAAPELRAVLEDARAPVLIAGPEYEEIAEDVAGSASTGPTVVRVATDYEEWLGAHAPLDPSHRADPDDVVLQLYTSGTTGVPKGVLTTHRNLAACAETSPRLAVRPQLGLDDATAHVPCWRDRLGVSRASGTAATTILVRDFDPEAVLDVLEDEHVTNAIFVPTMLQMLTAVPGAADRDFSALRSIVYGASPITDARVESGARHLPLRALRGLRADGDARARSSSSIPRTTIRAGRASISSAPSAGRCPWVELRIVDPVNGADCRTARGRRGVDARAQRDTRVLRTGPTRRPRRSRRTAGCARATAATSTRRATSSSPTASRT